MDSFFTRIREHHIRLVYLIFFHAYFAICTLQKDLGKVSFEDIWEVVRRTSEQLTPLTKDEMCDYAGTIYEAILKIKFCTSKGPYLCIKQEVVQSIDLYFKEILRVLDERKVRCTQNAEEIEVFLISFRTEVDNRNLKL
jgi:hypothetical protein